MASLDNFIHYGKMILLYRVPRQFLPVRSEIKRTEYCVHGRTKAWEICKISQAFYFLLAKERKICNGYL